MADGRSYSLHMTLQMGVTMQSHVCNFLIKLWSLSISETGKATQFKIALPIKHGKS